MERTPKANKNSRTWESYSDDDVEGDVAGLVDSRSHDDASASGDLDLDLDASIPTGKAAGSAAPLKRAMAEDKLQEKRLKERARRNGMAGSIDEMRTLVPELIEAKKNYSQAKVVAFALSHIYELQRENDLFRERLGLPSRMDEFRAARQKSSGKTKKERAPAGERGRKRRRLLNGDAATTAAASDAPLAAALPTAAAPAPVTLPTAPQLPFNAALPRPAPSVAAVSAPEPMALVLEEEEGEGSALELEMELDYVTDSLAASPALSPHALDDELGPFGHSHSHGHGHGHNFDTSSNFDLPLHLQHLPHAQHTLHTATSARAASHDWTNSGDAHGAFESFFGDRDALFASSSLH